MWGGGCWGGLPLRPYEVPSPLCWCQLEPLPRPTSPPAAADGGAGLGDGDTLHLQQLLLEGVANGTVRHGGDVERLVLSTFAAAQQVGPVDGAGPPLP